MKKTTDTFPLVQPMLMVPMRVDQSESSGLVARLSDLLQKRILQSLLSSESLAGSPGHQSLREGEGFFNGENDVPLPGPVESERAAERLPGAPRGPHLLQRCGPLRLHRVDRREEAFWWRSVELEKLVHHVFY